MSVTRTNVEFAKRILADRVGNRYVYGGNWNPFDLKVGTDCSGLVVDILDAAINGTKMAWTRHGMSTESWRPINVGQVGPFGTICVRSPADFPPDAAVKIAIHHGPGGGANSHTWCEVDGMRGESAGSKGCVTGNNARSVYDTSYANDWHYLPGPIVGTITGPVPSAPALSRQDKYALLIIAEGRRRNITPRGIQIALATGLVESNITVYSNAKVPASMSIPHDAVGSDGYSVGIFQQQVRDTGNGWWWGDAATCMDPTSSAGLFYDRLARLSYNGPNSPGSYAQAVQSSAFPDRYDQRFNDAVALYNRLSSIDVPTPGDDMAQVPQEQWDRLYRELTQKLPSRSPLRHLGEGLVDTMAGFILNADGSEHVEICRLLAGYGHPPTLALLREVAGADPSEYPDRQDDAKMAQAILADVAAPSPTSARVTTVVADNSQELAAAYDEINRLRAENASLQAAPAPAMVPLTDTAPAASTGGSIGKLYDSLEELRLADALPIESRAPLAALISVLQTKNGSQLQ